MLSWSWLLVLSLVACGAEKKRYDNYRVYDVVPGTQQDLAFLAGLPLKFLQKIDFWKRTAFVNKSWHIMVAPEVRERFVQALQDQGIRFSVLAEDVQKLIDNEQPHVRSGTWGVTWDDYHDLDTVYSWLDNITATYPTVATSVVGGKTYEGREIRGVRVSYKEGNPAVVIEAGIHAREWITVSFATYLINELLTSENMTIRNIAENFDFYIFPTVNPDGYEYSWTTDRMWRKTRKPYPPCIGADPNRNWDFHWGEEHSDRDRCSGAFIGPEAFSEVETRTLSQFLTGLGDKLQVYLAFHCYAQMLLFPYGRSTVIADNYDELLLIATRAAKALSQRYGTEYGVGSISTSFASIAGTSLDWVMGVLNVDYAFVWELRDWEGHNFELPTEQIIPTCEETTDSVLSVLQDVLAARRAKVNK